MNRGSTHSTHNLGVTQDLAVGGFRINNNKNKNKSMRKRASRVEAQKKIE
jgi:hypothetical protein